VTIATTAIEIERPKGWTGETASFFNQHFRDKEWIEVEVEGQVHFWTDNYGADADGNRGVEMTGCDVEDLEFTLYGDFRPFYIKIRDFFLLKWKNRGRTGACRYKWSQLSEYDHIRLDDGSFDNAELEEASEGLKRDAEEYEGDLRDFDEDAYYERKREMAG
jgi:hypothetical protein